MIYLNTEIEKEKKRETDRQKKTERQRERDKKKEGDRDIDKDCILDTLFANDKLLFAVFLSSSLIMRAVHLGMESFSHIQFYRRTQMIA